MSRLNPPLNRRAFLGAGIGTVLLSACGAIPAPGASTPANRGGIFGIRPAPSPSPTPPPTPVHFAHWLQDSGGLVMADIVRRYNAAHPHVVVVEAVRPFGEHLQWLRQNLAAGTPPDVFLISGADLPEQASAQTLLDLAPLVARDRINLDRYWTTPQARPVAGQQLALPLWASVDLIYFNRDLFTQAKLSEPAADWTWDQLLRAAGQLTVGKSGNVTRWGLLVVNDIPGGWGGFVTSNGGRWLDPATGQPELAAPAVEALQWVVDAINRHHVAPRPREQDLLTAGGSLDPFLKGNVALLVNGSWEMPTLLSAAPFVWDVAALPRAPRTGASHSVADAQPGAIARASRVPESAWGFLSDLVGEASQRRWARDKVRLPSLRAVAADPTSGFAAPPPTHAGVVVSARDTALDLEFRTHWQAFRNALVRGLQPAFDGDQPLNDVLPATLRDAERALSAP